MILYAGIYDLEMKRFFIKNFDIDSLFKAFIDYGCQFSRYCRNYIFFQLPDSIYGLKMTFFDFQQVNLDFPHDPLLSLALKVLANWVIHQHGLQSL